MKVIVQNLATEYEDEGEGRVLLFLHGWQQNLHSFDKLAPRLLPEYKVVRLDLPGFGKSETPKETWDLNRYVFFIADFIKKTNLDVYALIGHSFGGRIVIKSVVDRISAARKIILIDSGGMARRKTLRNFIFKIIAKAGRAVTLVPPFYFWRDGLRKRMYQKIGSRDYLNAGAMRKTFVRVINEDLSKDAEKIAVSTLLIWGEGDLETPLSDGKRMAAAIRGSRIEIFKNCGHFVHEEKPQEVAEAIKKFLC